MVKRILQRLRIPGFRDRHPVVAVLNLGGVIGGARQGFRPGLNLGALIEPLTRAFGMPGLAAVALAVNSPGGAPAQSSLIHKRIRALAAEKEVPVIAFAEDVAASGGYWLACAADEIYADENSIIGSLGVISAGFGFSGLIKRLGIERRIHTAGGKKSMLDPFLREDPDDVARLISLQGDIHESFKTMVRERRGDKLKIDEAELFSGEFWTGRRALELGLIDGIGELTAVMKSRFGDDVVFRPVAARRGWLRRRFAQSSSPPLMADGSWLDGVLCAVEDRALWNRFGL